MAKNYYTPEEIVNANIVASTKKANFSIWKTVLYGITSGAFIALGGAAANVVAHNISNLGMARIMSAVVFPVGLLMIIVLGGELFTGNCLMIMAVLLRKVSKRQFIWNLFWVFISNMIGAGIMCLLIWLSGQLNGTGGLIGAYTIKVAMGKLSLSASNAFTSGILCNILVCGAVLMAGSAKDMAGKCMVIFFPIFAFVISGFEHSVANMYFIQEAILASKNPEYVQLACTTYGFTQQELLTTLNVKTMFLHNLLPVTLGNMLGGIVCVGLVFFAIHKNKLFVQGNPSEEKRIAKKHEKRKKKQVTLKPGNEKNKRIDLEEGNEDIYVQ